MRRREFIAGLGSAAAWPLAARAQQAQTPVIGFLSGGKERPLRPFTAAFHQGLGESGFFEGRNVEILYRWAENQHDQLPTLTTDLIRHRVAVIVATSSTGAALAAKSATSTIPIVFQIGIDPVEFGLVPSISRPGGNITGVSFLVQELIPKRLELLHELVPTAATIGFLVNPTLPAIETQIREAEGAARILGVRLAILNASSASEIETAFATIIGQRFGALMAGSDPLFYEHRARMIEWAARHAVPVIYSYREVVKDGGLISYGSILSEAYRLAGVYAGRILKGEKPAELPVQQSTKVELAINIKTAKALGLAIPLTLLGRADEVIE